MHNAANAVVVILNRPLRNEALLIQRTKRLDDANRQFERTFKL